MIQAIVNPHVETIHREVCVKRLLFPHCLLLGVVAVALAGCGSSAANKASSSRPRYAATPVPTILVSYASAVDPTLKTTLQEGKSLLKQMSVKHPDYTAVANDCSMVGGDFSSYRSVFSGTYVPAAAKSAWYRGDSGFKLILAATDECGNAADAHSTKLFKTAESDLKAGLSQVSYAEWVLSHWNVRS